MIATHTHTLCRVYLELLATSIRDSPLAWEDSTTVSKRTVFNSRTVSNNANEYDGATIKDRTEWPGAVMSD